MTLGARSSNPYLRERPFLLGLVGVSPFLSNGYPAELVPSYRFD
jgi:hypothetical protein